MKQEFCAVVKARRSFVFVMAAWLLTLGVVQLLGQI